MISEEWEKLFGWLQTCGLTPDEIMTAVTNYHRDEGSAAAREAKEKFLEKEVPSFIPLLRQVEKDQREYLTMLGFPDHDSDNVATPKYRRLTDPKDF
jgi:hypothetical protein